MSKNRSVTEVLEDVRIIFRNFSGEERQMNKKGDRNFCVVLSSEQSDKLVDSGWNVRVREPREQGDDPLYYLPVAVGFNAYPPKIVLITSRGQTYMDEENISLLDWADILQVDLIVRAYDWEVSGNSGRKAYLKSMYVTIEEDELELKYNRMDMEE